GAYGCILGYLFCFVLFCLVNGEYVRYTPFRFWYIRRSLSPFSFTLLSYVLYIRSLSVSSAAFPFPAAVCFSCGSTGHVARDCPKNSRNGDEGSGNDKQAATKGRVFDSTANRATSASGAISGNSL
ncbi:putative reverse transcriptase domain-containing protein, partial [Tanacetum coccineum]